MSERSEDIALAAEFPPATREAWRKLVDGVLKGAPFDKRLVARTYDGLAIEPLYQRAADARPIAARAPGTPWTLMQRVDHPDPATANAEALHDLENGATGLALVFAASAGAHGYGLDPSPATIARALDGIYLDAGIALDLQLSRSARDAPGHVAALLQQRGIAPAATAIRFGLNPIGGMAATGTSAPWSELAPTFAGLVSDLAARGFASTIAAADGRLVHAAGGSEAQELAFVLAVAVAYLRALEKGGIALDAARRMIYFRLAADADQFLTIAKFRSVRKLWARVEQACGLAPAPAHVAAETAWRMMTRRDPYVNMLRATIAVAAAGFGGADAITVLPFTAALGLPDRFARRIARNTQLILLEESHLAKVADPAAGSGGIEDLTQKLCAAAWTLFQEIERAGGAVAALEAGLIQAQVAATRAEREKNVARRKDALTGTSEFPDIHEAAVHVLDVAPQAPSLPSPADGGGNGERERTAFAALPSIRLAEPFERLRDASDRALAATGARPKIFLANLGKLSDFTARTLFARNFFEAGGIEAVTNDGFAGRDAMVAAFRDSGTKLACLCSSDKVYRAQAADAAKALTAAGASHIYLAGRPGEIEAELKGAGVRDFIYVGCDVVAALQAAHDMLGLDHG
jgi:methylmalonyl-CoA mutase